MRAIGPANGGALTQGSLATEGVPSLRPAAPAPACQASLPAHDERGLGVRPQAVPRALDLAVGHLQAARHEGNAHVQLAVLQRQERVIVLNPQAHRAGLRVWARILNGGKPHAPRQLPGPPQGSLSLGTAQACPRAHGILASSFSMPPPRSLSTAQHPGSHLRTFRSWIPM